MRAILSISIISLVARLAAGQDCPALPDTGVKMGDPVPMRPEHIPAGCSDFEILVGKTTTPLSATVGRCTSTHGSHSKRHK